MTTERTFGVELEVIPDPRGPMANLGPRLLAEKMAGLISQAGVPCNYMGYTHVVVPHWKTVTDATVEADGGFEVVSPVLQGQAGHDQVTKVCAVLVANGMKVNKRCGLHVHVGVLNGPGRLSHDEIKAVVSRYSLHEKKIDAWMSPSRRNGSNRWCNSLRRHVSSPAFLGATTWQNAANVFGGAHDGRYYKVNLQSLRKYGTIEFRHHQGSVDAVKINNWIRFLLQFIDETTNKVRAPAASAQGSALSGDDLRSKVRRGTHSAALLDALLEAPEVGFTRQQLAERTGWGIPQLTVAIASFSERGFGVMSNPIPGMGRVKGYRIALGQATQQPDRLADGVEPALMAYFRERAEHFGTAGELVE